MLIRISTHYSPIRHLIIKITFDSHVLGMSLAFTQSQNQTQKDIETIKCESTKKYSNIRKELLKNSKTVHQAKESTNVFKL